MLHVHEHIAPGVENHFSANKYVIRPGDSIYEKYKFIFKGVLMKGNTLQEFIDDILEMGGPEKEFTFRGKSYFLETLKDPETGMLTLHIDEISNQSALHMSFLGNNFQECANEFGKARIFDGLTIYEAEQEIVVLYG